MTFPGPFLMRIVSLTCACAPPCLLLAFTPETSLSKQPSLTSHTRQVTASDIPTALSGLGMFSLKHNYHWKSPTYIQCILVIFTPPMDFPSVLSINLGPHIHQAGALPLSRTLVLAEPYINYMFNIFKIVKQSPIIPITASDSLWDVCKNLVSPGACQHLAVRWLAWASFHFFPNWT